MTARVVCMASAKGGSGKTLLTATFGAFLAELGYRVLMVDTDAATNGLSLFYLRHIVSADQGESPRLGLFELTGPQDTPAVVPIRDNLDLLPATYEFRNTEDTPLEVYAGTLRSVLAGNRDTYDFIFLDAQAGADEYAQISIDAGVSDQVVIVSEYDPISAAGVDRLKALFTKSLAFYRTWILLNKLLPDFVESFSTFLEITRYASPVPWDADVARAYARRQLGVDLERGNPHTVAVVQTLRSLFGELVEQRLDAWLAGAADAIREPARAQRRELERELAQLLAARQARRSLSSTPLTGAAFVLAALAPALIELAFAGDYLSEAIATVVAGSGGAAAIAAVAILLHLARTRVRPADPTADRRAELTARIDRFRELESLAPTEVVRETGRSERPRR